MNIFYNVLVNTVISSITNMTVWFAIIFYVYLQTKSVFATSIISGLWLVGSAASGFWFGSIVDHNKKKSVMIVSSIISMVAFAIGLAIYLVVGNDAFTTISNPILWVFVITLMLGVLIGNLRGITLPTLIGILVSEENRDKANGLAGTATGIAFLITSVISGLLVGHSGMLWVLILGVVLSAVTIIHIWFLHIDESKTPAHDVSSVDVSWDGTAENKVEHHMLDAKTEVIEQREVTDQNDQGDQPKQKKKVDVRGTIKVLNTIPGLFPLILFTTFNNFLGGVFMSLMDAYGLSLVSVQAWGLIWGFLSTAFIIGGIIIAKKGLGENPLKSMFMANVIIWTVSIFFTIQPSIVLLVVGCFIYLTVMPFIEASEHTIIQKVVPQGRQGRVFGFAQSVEQAASPLTAFLIGPLTQFVFIPFMTDGLGADLIGSWFGTGPARGMALVFTVTGMIGLVMTLLAMRSRNYRLLSEQYVRAEPVAETPSPAPALQ
jgi:DHA3 family multidrug efflux protein-like MFS transporter